VAIGFILIPALIASGIAAYSRFGTGLFGKGSSKKKGVIGGPAAPTTLLLMTTRTPDHSRPADTLTLFSVGGGQQPFVLLIPSQTLTEIPGYGFDVVGNAMSFGRVPLASIAVSNMLGIRIDHTVVIDDSAVAAAVDKIGPITVDVPSNLFAAQGGELVPVFSAGSQQMNGKQAVRYLTYQGPNETELSRLAREQQIFDAVFAKAGSGLAQVIGSMPVEGDTGAGELGRLLAAVSAAPQSARTYDVVPVQPVGAGGDEGAFKVTSADLDVEVGKFLSASRTGVTPGTHPRLQLLNGNGRPEAGVSVAQRLIPAGFRIVDSGNARSFDFAKTKIIVYANDDASMAVAQQVRKLLGVGEIEVAARSQTSVDVTVVIGKDVRTA